MAQKIVIGILAGAVIGLFMTSFFLGPGTPLKELFLTKITATSMITGVFCAIYAHLSKSKLQVFLICILIGILVFYVKYWITGHNFDPGIMGAFTGALLGGVFAVVRKLTHSFKVYRRLETLKKKGFNNYS
jgi:peptidoglycan/LPS O-acetylase OafA/YrhL